MMRTTSMLGVAAALVALWSQPALAQVEVKGPPGGMGVNVVNPDSDPVPVSIQNDSLAVTVANDAGAFLYQEVGGDLRHTTNLVFAAFDDVPPNSRLVIEDVSGRTDVFADNGNLPTAIECSLIVTDHGGLVVERYIPTTAPPVPFPSGDLTPAQSQSFSDHTLVFADAGQSVGLTCVFSRSADTLAFSASIAGHMYPAP